VSSTTQRLPATLVVAAAVVAAVLLGLLPAVAQESEAESPEALAEQLRGTREQAEVAEDELARTRQEIEQVALEVRDSEARLAVIEAERSALATRLTEAEAAAAAAHERTEEATDALVRISEDLAASEASLVESRQRLDDRAAAAYMRGNVDYAAVLLGASDISELLHTSAYLERVLESDQGLVLDITTVTLELERTREAADEQRATIAAAQAEADDAQRQLQVLAASAADLAVEAEQERANQQTLYARLENKQAATEAQLAELESQSAELEDELRRAQERAQFRAGAPGAGTFVWPSDGRLSSPFGYRTHPIYGTSRLHAGVDIAGGFGVPVVAANDGRVLSAYCSPGGYGCRVVIDHGGGIATLYAHLSSFAIGEGAVVAAGEVIAYTGSTGASTGPHLHFEVRENGAPVDPMGYL